MQHNQGSFPCRRHQLFCQSWQPETPPGAGVIVVHGLAEHSGRYHKLAEYLAGKGYAVYGYDHFGHGQSLGRRCYVNRFSQYPEDLGSYVSFIQKQSPGLPLFLLGHSMGALVMADYAAGAPGVAGLIFSSPLIQAGSSVGAAAKNMAKILSRLLPWLGVSSIEADAISRDAAVVSAYIHDPLVYRGKITARLGAELLTRLDGGLDRMSQIRLPSLFLHGTEDRLADPEGSRLAYQRLASKDKTLRLYPGLFHETMNEPEGAQVMEDIVYWLKCHL